MNNNLLVTKRNGEKESIDLEKIHKVVTWAAKGLKNVSVSQVEIKAQIQFYDGINTSEIHETLIKSAADLISTDAPDYQYLAARLAIFHPWISMWKRWMNLCVSICAKSISIVTNFSSQHMNYEVRA